MSTLVPVRRVSSSPAEITPPPEAPPTQSLRELLEVIFRHRTKLCVTTLAVVLTATLSWIGTPKAYRSTAKIILRRGRGSVTLSPTEATGTLLPVNKDWDYEINSEIEILNSQELLSQIVTRVGPETLIRIPEANANTFLREQLKRVKTLLGAPPDWAAASADADSSIHAMAIRELSTHIVVRAVPASDVITIAYVGANPVQAQEILSLMLELYLDIHIACRRTPEASGFFKKETDDLERKLRQTEAKILDLKNRVGGNASSTQEHIAITRLGALRTQHESLTSRRAACQARIIAVTTLLSPQKSRGGRTQTRTASVVRDLQTRLLRETSELESLDAERNTVFEQVKRARQKLQDLNVNMVALRGLERDRDILDQTYHRYLNHLEQSRINKALDTERISNVRIIQPATRPYIPEVSNGLLKLFGALVIGLFGGLGITFTAEHLDRTVWNALQIERLVHLPNLMSIPRANRRALFRTHRRIWRRTRKTGQCAYEEAPALKVSEAQATQFQSLRDSICLRAQDGKTDKPFVVALTSSKYGEGVSSIASGLALSFAHHHQGARVLLVRARDQRDLHEWMPSRDQASSVTGMVMDERGCIRVVERSLYTVEQGESVPKEGRPELTWERIEPCIREEDAAFVILDLPPISDGALPISLTQHADTTLLTVEAENTRREALRRSVETLQEAGATVLGTILNNRIFHLPEWLYQRV